MAQSMEVQSAPQQDTMAVGADADSLENKQTICLGEIYNTCCCPCASLGCSSNMVTIEKGSVGVVKRLGKFHHLLPPGRHSFNTMAEEIMPVSLKVHCLDVRPQEVMTADKLSVRIDAVCFFRVFDAEKAIFRVENYPMALANLAQVTIRTVLGENTLAEIFGQRQKLNQRLKELIDHASDPWGIKVGDVELKGITIDQQMQRAMAAKAEANQMAEAKIIQSKAQRDAASILAEAAGKMDAQPAAIKLQWMETLRQVTTQGRNRTIIIPKDMDPTSAMAVNSMGR